MKKIIIIHAWESSPEEHWYREEEKLLKEKGFKVLIPEMPGGRWPKLDEWLKVIEALEPDENTDFIGHSLGPAAIFRYLEKTGQRIDMVISIAGFARDLRYEETKDFVEEPFDWKKIKKLTNKVISVAQKNDPYVAVEISKEIADKTNGKFVLVEGNNHFDKMDLDMINEEL